MPDEDVTILLTGDEALVLFDVLHRWQDDGQVSGQQNEAEQVALWNLSAVLERALVEPFNPRYNELVAEARARLTPKD